MSYRNDADLDSDRDSEVAVPSGLLTGLSVTDLQVYFAY